MARTTGLQVEECWSPGGRLSVAVDETGSRVRIWGNPDGLVGLARVLLWSVHNGMQTGKPIDLAAFGAFEPGAVTLEVGD
jgi:hypothetical protein